MTGSAQECSDLDLVLRHPVDPAREITGWYELKEALVESRLPMLVDIALQGQISRDILCKLAEPAEQRKIRRLDRSQLCKSVIAGVDVIVSRTGYTGEKMAFEIFVHPDDVVHLWNAIMEVGTPLGMLPCGLAARDSLRTEAGLPLYGHEMGGETNLTVAEAGFLPFLKLDGLLRLAFNILKMFL